MTPFVIHAVGTNYATSKYEGNTEKGDAKLRNAYRASMMCAREKGVESITFSLFSAGVFWGDVPIHHVLCIAMRTIIECGYEGLREVHLCGHSQDDFFALIDVARDLGLTRE